MLKIVLKKIISLSLAVLMVFALCSASVSANTNAVIYATDVTAKPGDTVKVEVVLDFNPGINTLRLFVDYSSECFELVSSTDGGILGQSTYSKELSAKPYVLYWTNSSKNDFTKNGVLATLEFKVKKSVSSGGYPITLSFKSANDCINSKLAPVLAELDNGVITVQNEQDSALSSSVTSNNDSDSSLPELSSNPNTVSKEPQNVQSTQSNIDSETATSDLPGEQSPVTSQEQTGDENGVNIWLVLGLAVLGVIIVAVVVLILKKKLLAK